ncbi:hypothetical protein ACGF12_26870 [Kitasatospora sp. NPDC048296]|uniref:hypothetical protein n=1 Tax=Kitasatospora sp. NPDC048296 TaxID=3364048 RepID=UPI0037140E10
MTDGATPHELIDGLPEAFVTARRPARIDACPCRTTPLRTGDPGRLDQLPTAHDILTTFA